jgi:hypothetical protein
VLAVELAEGTLTLQQELQQLAALVAVVEQS